MLILEESVVDLGAKRLVSLTRNIDHKKLVVATETIEYIPSRGDSDKTLMTRHTSIRSPLGGLTGRTIEKLCHARAIKNVKRTLQVRVERKKKERERRVDFWTSHVPRLSRKRPNWNHCYAKVISERESRSDFVDFRRDFSMCSHSKMESLQESRESPSADFVMRLYAIYALLYFFVLVLDYFLWTSKFWFPPFRKLIEEIIEESIHTTPWQTLSKIINLSSVQIQFYDSTCERYIRFMIIKIFFWHK